MFPIPPTSSENTGLSPSQLDVAVVLGSIDGEGYRSAKCPRLGALGLSAAGHEANGYDEHGHEQRWRGDFTTEVPAGTLLTFHSSDTIQASSPLVPQFAGHYREI